MPVTLALRRLRQEGLESEASLSYIARSCLKKKVAMGDRCKEALKQTGIDILSFLGGLGFELKALYLQRRCSTS
jgi:hypothetical protein